MGADPTTDAALRFGRREFVRGAGAVAGASALAGLLPERRASALAPGASIFQGLPRAVRVVDTRAPGGYSFQWLADNRLRLTLAGDYGVPADATAVVATVAAVNRDVPNFVAVFPAGASVPQVSNLNLPYPYEINANLVTVKVGAGGAVDVYSNTPCDVIVDLTGYYVPVGGPVRAGRYVGLDIAQRVADTRPDFVQAGQIVAVDVNAYGAIPPGASNVVVNLTATECVEPGYCTVFPYDDAEVPPASSLNWSYAGATRASAVIVPLGDNRLIKVFTLTPAKLIVDVTGYFTGEDSEESEEGTFVPLDPVRILDTRAADQRDNLAPGGVLWPGWTREALVPGPAADSASVLINLTGTDTRGPGYLTVGPAGVPLPGTSNVNWTLPGTTVPNHAITRISNAGLQVFTSHGAAIVADLGGYYVGRPAVASSAPPENPAPPPIDVPWILRIPGLGLDIGVLGGDSRYVTDRGYSWHWAGTGLVGEFANIGIFAHRTEHGGAFRYLQYLQPGHEWWIDTADGRRYVYVMTRRDLTDSNNENILNAVRFEVAPSCSLIACTVGYDSTRSNYPDIWAPTSTRYRIVVTGRLSHWHALW